MPPWAAFCGALALVGVNIATSGYIVDVIAFNKGLRRKDKIGDDGIAKLNPGAGYALLGLALAAEITLALLIGVIPGLLVYSVLAFPLLAGAGVFVAILRLQLAERESQLAKKRTQQAKPEGETATKPRRVAMKLPRNKIDIAKLADALQRNPPPSQAQLALEFRVSHTAIGKATKKVLPAIQAKARVTK